MLHTRSERLFCVYNCTGERPKPEFAAAAAVRPQRRRPSRGAAASRPGRAPERSHLAAAQRRRSHCCRYCPAIQPHAVTRTGAAILGRAAGACTLSLEYA